MAKLPTLHRSKFPFDKKAVFFLQAHSHYIVQESVAGWFRCLDHEVWYEYPVQHFGSLFIVTEVSS